MVYKNGKEHPYNNPPNKYDYLIFRTRVSTGLQLIGFDPLLSPIMLRDVYGNVSGVGNYNQGVIADKANIEHLHLNESE